MATFRELSEHRLSALRDDELIDYLRAARAAGRHEAMKAAIAVLVHGYHPVLLGRARLKLPDADVEDVVAETLVSAIASAFDGRSVGEFKSWLHTILSRRIADYHDDRSRKAQTAPLQSEHAGDDAIWGDEPSEPFEGDALHARGCLERAYGELGEGAHQDVIDLYVLGPHSAARTAELVGDGMTEANVHQIASRFGRRFRELLETDGDTAGDT